MADSETVDTTQRVTSKNQKRVALAKLLEAQRPALQAALEAGQKEIAEIIRLKKSTNCKANAK